MVEAGESMPRSWATAAIAVGLLVTMTGCVVSDLGVSNPMPHVRRVAIAPFINLTTEPDVDLGRNALFGGGYVDRRFALAYFAELQKTPGFEVIPVGVVEQAIARSGLAMNGPEDYLAVAESIGADAIVIGAVTDFDPYHPRLGFQVQWYANDGSPPPAPTMPYEREWDDQNYIDPEQKGLFSRHWRSHAENAQSCSCGSEVSSGAPCDVCVARGQSPTDGDQTPSPLDSRGGPSPTVVAQSLAPPINGGASTDSFVPEIAPLMPSTSLGGGRPLPPQIPANNRELLPLYSYTRFFDGHDARVTARLRDYVELSGDLRSGGWESYLDRSDDFIRFACHVTIQEMLLLHGGESSRRTVFKVRKELFRKL